MQAASSGNIALLEVLLRLGADLSVRADDGSTALHCAVIASQISMVECLLKNGARIDPLNQKDQSPLHQAVLNRDRAVFRLLMQNGAALSEKVLDDVIKPGLGEIFGDALQIGGESLLRYLGPHMLRRASEWDQASIISSLLQSPLIDREWILSYGFHTLFAALIHGRLTTFQCLLAGNKMDPNMRVGRKTFLHFAAVRGQVEILELFLQCEDCDVNAMDGNGNTPLKEAAAKGQTATVGALLSHPRIMVNYSSETSSNRSLTALHLAARAGHIDVARLLLEHSGISFNPRDANGETPLYSALRPGPKATEMVSLFLKHDEVDAALSRGSEETLLMTAIIRGYEDMVKLLINHPRANPLDARHGKAALLELATFNLQWNIVHYLLHGDNNAPSEQDETDQGLDDIRRVKETATLRALLKEESFSVNKQYRDGQTLLHKLVSTSHPSLHLIDQLLQSHDLQPNRIDKHGWTALHYAVSNGQIENVKLLLGDARTDVNVHGSDTKTVLRCANGNFALLEILLRHGADEDFSEDHEHDLTPPLSTGEEEKEHEEVRNDIELQQSSDTTQEGLEEDSDHYDSESMDGVPDEHGDARPKPRLWAKNMSWEAAWHDRWLG
jgi:ankyrin repeat protein